MAVDFIILDQDQEPLIKTVIYRLWDVIGEDGQSPDDYPVDPARDIWLGAFTDQYIGCFQLQRVNQITLNIHSRLLPEYRKEHSLDAGFALLAWIMQNTTYERVEAIVPTMYPNVLKYMETIGFINEGTLRQSYRKNGQTVDRVIMGLLRPEIIQILEDRNGNSSSSNSRISN